MALGRDVMTLNDAELLELHNSSLRECRRLADEVDTLKRGVVAKPSPQAFGLLEATRDAWSRAYGRHHSTRREMRRRLHDLWVATPPREGVGLREISSRTGISRRSLSQFRRGLYAIDIAPLLKILEMIGVDIPDGWGALAQEPAADDDAPENTRS